MEHTYLIDDLVVLQDKIDDCIKWLSEMTEIIKNESGEVPEEVRKIRANLVMAGIETRRLIESEDIA